MELKILSLLMYDYYIIPWGSLVAASGPFDFFFFFPTRVGIGGSYLRFLSWEMKKNNKDGSIVLLLLTFKKLLYTEYMQKILGGKSSNIKIIEQMAQ